MIISKKFKSIKAIENGYLIDSDGPSVKLIFMNDAVVRIRASFDGKFKESSYLLTQTAWEDDLDQFMVDERKRIVALNVAMNENNKEIVFSTKEMNLVLTKEPFSFAIYDKEGTLLHEDLKGKAYLQDHLGRVFHYQVSHVKQDRFYGFGERTGNLNQAGRRLRFASKDSAGFDSERGNCLYKHIPFYIKMNQYHRKAIGVFYHNTYESFFDVGEEISGYWGSGRPSEFYSYFGSDGGDLDVFYMVGPDISKIIEHYTDLTGKSTLMPLDAFGYHGSTMYYTELPSNSDDAIIKFGEKIRKLGIPMDGFCLSSGYTSKNNKRYVFYWNNEKFNDPSKFFKKMSDLGITVSANVKPGVLTSHPYFNDFKDNEVFVKTKEGDSICLDRWWGGEGAFFDFTHPKARNFWKKSLKKALIDNGCTAIWNDNNEYDSIEDRESKCYFDGKGGVIGELKPIMANLMAKMSYQALAEYLPNKRPYVITRAGAAGIQRYAQTWCGDNLTEWKTIKYNMATVLGMGLSGMAHVGGDVGGHCGIAPSEEMLLRWAQSAVFYPRFSIHSNNDDNTVTEPWMYKNITHLIKGAIDLRYSLLPYFYSLNVNAYLKGEPILRPMIYHFQSDNNLDDESDQAMLGRALLAAPIMEKNQKLKTIYLPYGEEWLDLNSGKSFIGGYYTFDVQLDSIPMFLRAGELLPTTTDFKRLDKDKIKNLNIHSFPTKNGSFTYYEDDYVSQNYLNKEWLATNINVKTDGEVVCYNFSREGNFKSSLDSMTILLYSQKAPFFVNLDQMEMMSYLDREEFDSNYNGIYYDHDKKVALIKFKNPKNKHFILNVNFKAIAGAAVAIHEKDDE